MIYPDSPIPAFSAGQGFLLAVSVLSWLAVAFILTSSHLSTVVGAWLLAHGVEMAKFRAARRRLTGDMQRLAETMIPPAGAHREYIGSLVEEDGEREQDRERGRGI